MRIPIREYEKLATRFNPARFDADEWAGIARDAGMKYMVVTAKHHDGFAMFHSKYDRYNIVEATPYKADPLAALSKACGKAGIRLGFYYSQDLDWHEKGATGNTWDFTAEEKTPEAFEAYLQGKVRAQLRELLTNYGGVALIWFDTTMRMSESQCLSLKEFVHALQPRCLVSGRLGNGLGDYGTLGDNEIPRRRLSGAWEGLGTINGSWGIKFTDREWKSPRDLLEILARQASNNANYLLNVGPTAKGEIPAPCRKGLSEMGHWLRTYGESIYGSGPNPFTMYHQPEWGYITTAGNKIYLHIFRTPRGDLLLYGLRNPVRKVSLLGDSKRAFEFSEIHKREFDYHKLAIGMRRAGVMRKPYVIAVETAGRPDIYEGSYAPGAA
jgi:alpha-L-fucosidase